MYFNDINILSKWFHKQKWICRGGRELCFDH